jgi:hypothetical protein
MYDDLRERFNWPLSVEPHDMNEFIGATAGKGVFI